MRLIVWSQKKVNEIYHYSQREKKISMQYVQTN